MLALGKLNPTLHSNNSDSMDPEASGASELSASGRGGVGRPVTLRVEYVANLEAALLSWAVFGLTIIMFATIVAACVIKWMVAEDPVLFYSNAW